MSTAAFSHEAIIENYKRMTLCIFLRACRDIINASPYADDARQFLRGEYAQRLGGHLGIDADVLLAHLDDKSTPRT